jgi:hypothetical protein
MLAQAMTALHSIPAHAIPATMVVCMVTLLCFGYLAYALVTAMVRTMVPTTHRRTRYHGMQARKHARRTHR